MTPTAAAAASSAPGYLRVVRGSRETVHQAGCPRLLGAAKVFSWDQVAHVPAEELVRTLPGRAPWMQACHVCLPPARPGPQQMDIGEAAPDPLFVDVGMRRALTHTPELWRRMALRAIESMAATGRDFQAYDLVTELGLPEPDHHCRWGPAFADARRRGLIVRAGAAQSTRPETKGSLTRLWRGAGVAP